jgi:hypothetical protein
MKVRLKFDLSFFLRFAGQPPASAHPPRPSRHGPTPRTPQFLRRHFPIRHALSVPPHPPPHLHITSPTVHPPPPSGHTARATQHRRVDVVDAHLSPLSMYSASTRGCRRHLPPSAVDATAISSRRPWLGPAVDVDIAIF